MISSAKNYSYYISMKSKTGTLHLSLFLFFICVLSSLFPPDCTSQPYNYSIVSFAKVANNNANSHFIAANPPSSAINCHVTGFSPTISDTLTKKDTDGDGIIDSLDKCPDEKGVIQYDGCPIPDSDNDGIADDADACPTIAGLTKYKGCPPPDVDGDKINDEDDKCPNQAGVARYDGCPVGDKDGDGVNDDDDKCINLKGTLQNQGCPESKKSHTLLLKARSKSKAQPGLLQ
jgi:Thrombospondin type 3 repeat